MAKTIDPTVQQSVQQVLSQDPGTRVQVEDPVTGELTTRLLSETNPAAEKVHGISAQPAYEKFGGPGSALKVAAESALDTLSLGAYSTITNIGRTEAEREAVKKEKSFHPGAEFAGITAGFAVPGLGFTKLGAIPGLGARAGEAIVQGGGSGLNKILAQTAIEGATLGATQGIVHMSLEDYSKESIASAFMETALGTVIGAATGVAIHGMTDLMVPSLKGMFKGNAGKPVEFNPQAFAGAQTLPQQVSLNASKMGSIVDEYRQLLTVADKTPEQQERAYFLNKYIESLPMDKDLFDAISDRGTQKLDEHFARAEKIFEAEKAYGNPWPSGKVVADLGDNINQTIDDFVKLRIASGRAETLWDPTVMDVEMGGESRVAMLDRTTEGDGSLLNNIRQTFIEATDKEILARKIATDYRIAHGEQIAPDVLERAVKSQIREGAAPEAYNAIEKAVTDAERKFGVGRNAANLNTVQPSHVFQFFNEVVKALNEVRGSGLLKSPADRAFFKKIYDPMKQELVNPANFGEFGAKRARISTAIGEANSALGPLKKMFNSDMKEGKFPNDLIEFDKFKRLASKSSTFGQPSLRDFDATFTNFVETIKNAAAVIKAEHGEEAISAQLAELYKGIAPRTDLDARLAQVRKLWDWQQTMKDKNVQNWYNYYSKGALAMSEAAKWATPSMSPMAHGVRAAEDVLSGSLRYAKIQMLRAIAEQLVVVASKFRKPATFEEFYVQQLEAMRRMARESTKIKGQVAGTISKMLSTAGKATGIVTKALPYVFIQGSQEGQEKIDKEFNKVSKRLREQMEHPEQLLALQKQVEPMSYLTPGAGEEIGNMMVQKLSALAQEIPTGPPALQGSDGPSYIEKANFLDKITAMSNVDMMLDMLGQGSATYGMIEVFAQSFPGYWRLANEEALGKLLNTPDMSLEARTLLMSTFGLETVPMPIPGLATPAPTGQIPQPQPQAPGAMNKEGQPTRKLSGKKPMSTSQLMGTFTQTGGSGAT